MRTPPARPASFVLGLCLIFWLCLGLGLSACSRTPRNLPIGGDLHNLPSAGSASLVTLIPARAEAVLAMRNPAASLVALQTTGLWKRLAAEGWFQDGIALPAVERWRAMQAKLSELARVPLPGPEALLECPSILAFAPEAAGQPAGLLYVARLDVRAAASWSLGRALNAVRSYGREVEIERIRGVPVRVVAFGSASGPGTWFLPGKRLVYAVLADRLLLSTDEALLAEALQLALDQPGHSLGARAPFADLETRAATVGFAAAWVPSSSARWLPGLRSAELDGRDLLFQLDPGLWSDSTARPVSDPDALLRLGFAGLDLRAAWSRVRPQLEGSVAPSVLQTLDALAPKLGRGLFVDVVPRVASSISGMAMVVDAQRNLPRAASPAGSADADDTQVAALAAVLLDHPLAAEPIAGGVLHCSAGSEVCLASCDGVVRLGWPGDYVRDRGCPAERESDAAGLLFSVGGRSPLLAAELREGRGQLMAGESP